MTPVSQGRNSGCAGSNHVCMRTKFLEWAVLLSLAGLSDARGQMVTSNAIGFVNIHLGRGFNLIANPLNGPNNQLQTILPLPDTAEGTTLYRFRADQSGFADAITFYGSGVGWFVAAPDPNSMVIQPGEGFFIFPVVNGVSAPLDITFFGEVPTGTLTRAVGATGTRYSMCSSILPRAGKLGTAGTPGTLLFPAGDQDQVYLFNNSLGTFENACTYYQGYGWFSPSNPDVDGPVIPVGTAFWVFKAGASAPWQRTFSLR